LDYNFDPSKMNYALTKTGGQVSRQSYTSWMHLKHILKTYFI